MRIKVVFKREITKEAVIEMSQEAYAELMEQMDDPKTGEDPEKRVEAMIAEAPEQDSGFVLHLFREQLY